MEDKLDDVEEGKEDWRAILREFYPPFEKMLGVAEEQIEKVEVKDEVSDVPCDKCGAMMVYKMGRFGKFLACPNFPECRNTKPIVNYIARALPQVRRAADGEDLQEEPQVLRLRALSRRAILSAGRCPRRKNARSAAAT